MVAIDFQRFAVHEIPLPFIEPEDPHLGRDVAQIAALVEDQAQRYFVARVVDMAQELDQRLFGTAAAQRIDDEQDFFISSLFTEHEMGQVVPAVVLHDPPQALSRRRRKLRFHLVHPRQFPAHIRDGLREIGACLRRIASRKL